jgi:hypothetical protein
MNHKEIPALPQSVEAVLREVIENLRCAAARADNAENILRILRESMADKPDILSQIEDMEAQRGRADVYIKAVRDTASLIEGLLLERMAGVVSDPLKRLEPRHRV